MPRITIAQVRPDTWLGQDIRLKLEALWRMKECSQAELAHLVVTPSFEHYGPNSQEEPDSGTAWSGKFMVGWNDQKTGLHRYNWPEPSRLAMIVKYLIEHKLLTLVEIHTHLGLYGDALAQSKARGYDHYLEEKSAMGRLRGAFIGSDCTHQTITHEVMIALWLAGEELGRVRRIRVIAIRDEDEGQNEFQQRAEALCYDDFSVEDCWISIGDEFGVLFSEGGADKPISKLVWDKKNRVPGGAKEDKARNNRVQSFVLAPASEEGMMNFKLCYDAESVTFAQKILNSVSTFVAQRN